MATPPTRFTALQWLWIAAVLATAAATLADLAGWLAMPSLFWLLGYALLALAGRWAMPSREQLKQANRKRP